jgi:streptogramin lyase
VVRVPRITPLFVLAAAMSVLAPVAARASEPVARPFGGFAGSGRWIVHPTWGPYARMSGMTGTPDGLLWLSARGGLIRMTPFGEYTVVSTGPVDPQSLTVGADGRVYSVGCCTLSGQFAVLAVTSGGVVSTYLPASGDGINDGVVLGPDGNVWFGEERHVANVRPDGKITEYVINLPSGSYANNGYGIGTVAGKVWFPIWHQDFSAYLGYIVGVDPKSGAMTETQVPCFDPSPVVGAAGAVWAGCAVAPFQPVANFLCMMPDGTSTMYANRDWLGSSGAQAFIASRRRLWFVTDGAGPHPNRLGAFDLITHRVVDFTVPKPLGTIGGITYAPDGHVWVNSFNAGYPAAGEFLQR